MTGSIDDRIQQVLDGASSPEERAQLDALLAADPEARRRYDELRSLFDALAGEPAEAAPAGLHEDVMRSLPDRARAGAARTRRWALPRLALPFAAAAVAAVIIFVTLRGGPPVSLLDGRSSGTMSGAPPRAFRLGLGTEGAALHVTLWREAEGAARVVVVSDVPTRVNVSSALGAVGVTEGTGSASRGMSATAPDHIELTLGPGAERALSCGWTGASAALRLHAETATGEVSEVRLDLTSLPIAPGR
jgi:hypothetical protein